MDATSVFIGRKLTEWIDAKKAANEHVIKRGMASDFPDYKYRAGYLSALDDVLEELKHIDNEEETNHFARAS
jgi:hypothetical protein